MIHVTIDRSKWLRGDPNNSYLRRSSDGKQCCMGFFARKLGVSASKIKGVETLRGLSGDYAAFEENHEEVMDNIYHTNDTKDMRDNDREVALIKLGEEIGVKFTFVDKLRRKRK